MTAPSAGAGGGRRPRLHRARLTPVWGTVLLGGLMLLAGVTAAILTIAKNPTELGSGDEETRGEISWWSESSVGLTMIPATVPAAASLVEDPPTVLTAANQSYRVDVATAGNLAVLWNFTEAAGANLNAELEIDLFLVNGTTPTTTSITIYLETQAAAPTGPFTISLYLDAGTGPLEVRSETQISNLCAGLHNCP